MRPNDLETILSIFSKDTFEESLQLEFRSTLASVLSMLSIRLDAKFRWLWDKQYGQVRISNTSNKWWSLSSKMTKVDLEKVCGLFDEPKLLVNYAIRQNGEGVDMSLIEEDGAVDLDKVVLKGVDFALSRLRPYLGKFIMNLAPDLIGSSELVGLKLEDGISFLKINLFLSLPEFREAFRMLQTGKRHPRLKLDDLLELETNVNLESISDGDLS